MADYKFSENDESEECKYGSSVSLQADFSNETSNSQQFTMDLQELKEESLEMSIQQKKLSEKYENAKQFAYSKHFEIMQLVNQLFGTHMKNIELLYENKQSVLSKRQKLLNQTYKRVSQTNTPLTCGHGITELKFDVSSMSLHESVINENEIFSNENDYYDANIIENFEFSKLKKLNKLVKKLETINNDLKFDNALIKLKNKENKEWQKQNENNNNNNNNSSNNNVSKKKKNINCGYYSDNNYNMANSNSASSEEDDTVMIDYEYNSPMVHTPQTNVKSNKSNKSNKGTNMLERRISLNAISGMNETRHLKVKTISIPNLDTFSELIDTVNDDDNKINKGIKNGVINHGAASSSCGIVTTSLNTVRSARQLWEEKSRQSKNQGNRGQSHGKTRSYSHSPGYYPSNPN